MFDYRVAVVQDGARLHYTIPLAFHRLGMLDRVFCDWCELVNQTWPHSDHMTSASDYVCYGFVAQGIAPEKNTVNPYPVDATHFPEIRCEPRDGPVTVGFVANHRNIE
jgi:hypothetical protein